MENKKTLDYSLLTAILSLISVGLVMNYSASSIYALEKYGSSVFFLVRQLIWISIGLVGLSLLSYYDCRKLKIWSRPLLFFCFISLLLVLVLGREVGGAKRWLRFSGIGFQPSELTKLALILFVSYYCDKKKSKLTHFKSGLFPLLIILGTFCGLIFIQPDFGTAVLIGLSCMTLIFIAGASWDHLLTLVLVGVPLLGMAAWAQPYRRRRILSFLNPWENSQGSSYQLAQSLLALGSGGLKGVGLGNSHAKLFYLPELHTDFIFPIFAEEMGLAGSLAILALFAMIVRSGFKIASQQSELFSQLLATGITLVFFYQVILNIAVVTGCLPTKGLSLPLVSFGGSSVVVTLAGLGILLSLSRYGKQT